MNSRRIAFVLCAFAMAVSLGLVAFDHGAAGEENGQLPSWMDVQPNIQKTADITPEDYSQQLSNTNFPCTYKDLYTWGYNPNFGPPRLEYTRQGCFTPVDGGEMSGDMVVPYGARQAQKLIAGQLDRVSFFPASNSSTLALLSNSYAFYNGSTPTLHLVNNWTQTFKNYELDSFGNVERRGDNYHTFLHTDGSPVDIRSNGMAFSANGQWLHASATDQSEILINTSTYEILPFASYIGTDYAKYAAASNDGRYVAIATPYQGMTIYDLKKCGAVNGELQSRNCQSRGDIYDQLKSYTGTDDLRIFRLEFVGADNSLDVRVAIHNPEDNTWKYEKYRLSLPGSRETRYLAMGDSFSSGEGAYDYRSPTDFYIDDTSYNLCHQSKNSYPYLIQKTQNFDWFNSIACSGARVKDVVYGGSATNYLAKDSQSKALSEINEAAIDKYVGIFSPGYVPQINFVKKYSPSVATISIGGNDIGFGDIISTCIINKNVSSGLGQECFNDRQEREQLANQIDQKISALALQYRAIKDSMSGPEPRLYVIGYPQIIRPEGFCGLNVPLLQSELYAATALTDYINAAIKAAADAAGVRFVNMTNAFVDNTGDYRLCSDKNELAVNGLVLLGESNKKPDQWPYYSESFHPNQLGQTMMANTLRQQTANLMQEMPAPKDSTANLHDKRINFVGDDNVLYQNYRITYQKDIAPLLVTRGGQLTIDSTDDNNDLPIQAGTDVTAILHSEPVEIGHLPIAPDGKISGNVIIPADTEPGYHKLILRYVDISGNTIERYQFVYVAASSNDWDGDGLSNMNDPCSITLQSGIDKDDDGIDDACDDEYVKTASVPSGLSPLTSDDKSTVSNNSTSNFPVTKNPINLADTSSDDNIFFSSYTPAQLPINSRQSAPNNSNRETSGEGTITPPLSYSLIALGLAVCGAFLVIWLKNHIKS